MLLAGVFNSVMDTITHYFNRSIFKDLNKYFWNPQESWKGKKFLGWMVLDAWHLAKFGMLFSLIAAAMTYSPITPFWMFDFGIMCFAWAIGFELFYTKIWR
jgi:hypothetical protein